MPLPPRSEDARSKVRRGAIGGFSGSLELRKWFDDLARFAGRTKTDLIVDSLRLFAKSKGFKTPQPPR